MSNPTDLASAVQTLAAKVLGATTDPADAVRIMSELTGFATSGAGDMDVACANLCRRASVVALARATVDYQPASYDDAAQVRLLVCDLLDGEITIAGDSGEDATYAALRDLRSAVSKDLTARGASLATVETVTFGATMPALAMAQRLYQDGSRVDELVGRSDVVHPAFMPGSVTILSR